MNTKKISYYLSIFFYSTSLLIIGFASALISETGANVNLIEEIEIKEKYKESVFQIDSVSPFNIKLKGISGNPRLFIKNDFYEIKEGQSISADASGIYLDIQSEIPDGAMFFASKRGKKIYDISNIKKLNSMSKKNLIFYSNEEEAINDNKTK